MSKRNTILLIAGSVGLVIVLAGLAFWWFSGGRNTVGETSSSLEEKAQAPLPPIIGTAEPTSGAVGGTATPGSAPTPQIEGTFQAKLENMKLDPPPSMEALLEKYPRLGQLLKNLNLDDQEKLKAVYAQLLEVYQNEGFAGLQTVVEAAGILEALNLDSAYFDFIMAYQEGGIEAAEAMARQRGLVNADDELRIIVILDVEDASVLEPTLSELGGHVIRQYKNEVEVGLPIERIKEIGNSEDLLYQLVQLSHLEHVVSVQAPELTKPNSVRADEGPGVTGADRWHQAGYSGQGIKIGVIDPDGFYGFLNLLGTKLPTSDHVFVYPADPQFLNDRTGEHGTACAEVLHEMAPGADLYLAYSGGATDGLGDAIDWMLSNGVKVISYSASSLVGPKDGKGPVSELVRYAVDQGVLWVNSSGNYAQTHLKMKFTDTDGNGWHEFPDGDEIMRIAPYNGGTMIGLSWDDVYDGSTENYDLYILTPRADGSGFDEVVSERSAQSGRAADHPWELLYTEFTEGGEYYVAVRSVNITRPANMNLLADGVEFLYWMVDGSLGSPADSPDVISVGATNWHDDSLEPYSSQGPTDDGRLKPDISAPAGVTSATYGEFFGTSASAPHVAGAAALVWNAYPQASATEVRDYLLGNALDLGEAGQDNGFGVGRLALPEPPVVGEMLEPTGPPAVTIQSLWQEHNATVAGIRGVKIHISFQVENFQNQPGTVTAIFYNQDTGEALRDVNGSYTTSSGEVAVSEGFTPLYQPTLYSDFILFMPYNELELGEGEYNLQFQLTIRDDASGQVLASSDMLPFLYQQEDSIQPIITLTDVDVEHNVVQDRANGMNIKVTFDIANFRNQEGEVGAYFYFKDVSNRRLKDYNGYYSDPNGYVAVGVAFVPGYNDTTYDPLQMFMPYGELHIYEEEHYDLKFHLVIWDKTTGKELATSDWVYFWFEP